MEPKPNDDQLLDFYNFIGLCIIQVHVSVLATSRPLTGTNSDPLDTEKRFNCQMKHIVVHVLFCYSYLRIYIFNSHDV